MLTKKQRRLLEVAKRNGKVLPYAGKEDLWNECVAQGWLDVEGALTDKGRLLLNTEPGSAQECFMSSSPNAAIYKG